MSTALAPADTDDTITDVLSYLRSLIATPTAPAPIATPMPLPRHEGMTAAWFDLAVKRAFDAGLCIQRTARESVVAVSSSTDADVSYLVTAGTCECRGHKSTGRCFHRAYALFFWWCLECDAVAEAAHRQAVAA